MLCIPVSLSSKQGRHEKCYRSKQLLQTPHVSLHPAPNTKPKNQKKYLNIFLESSYEIWSESVRYQFL
jgi:hypothetical protein